MPKRGPHYTVYVCVGWAGRPPEWKLFHQTSAQWEMPHHGAEGTLIISVMSSQVTFIYIALLTIQILSKQLHNIKIGK